MKRKFVCEICRCGFFTKFLLNLHKSGAHFSPAHFMCVCGTGCNSQSNFEQHKREFHEVEEVAVNSLYCSLCKHQYTRKDTYDHHFTTNRHTANMNKRNDKEAEEEQEHVERMAQQQIISEKKLLVAQRKKTKNERLMKKGLLAHQRIVKQTEKPVAKHNPLTKIVVPSSCRICHKIFLNKKKLEIHKIHSHPPAEKDEKEVTEFIEAELKQFEKEARELMRKETVRRWL